MASRRQRREWRSEFKGLGTRQVTERERRSIWHNEEKAQEARRWLRTQERPLRYGSSDRRACHVSRRHCRRPHWRLVQVMAGRVVQLRRPRRPAAPITLSTAGRSIASRFKPTHGQIRPLGGKPGQYQTAEPGADQRRRGRRALTGCRYGELCRLKVADYNADVETLRIREAKSGQMRHVTLTGEAPELIERLIAGRSPAEMLFKRDDGRGWKRAEQLRPMRDGCKRAGIGPAVSFHVLRHTHASILAMRAVPMAVIARQLGIPIPG
jgi:integrase